MPAHPLPAHPLPAHLLPAHPLPALHGATAYRPVKLRRFLDVMGEEVRAAPGIDR